MDTPWQHRFAQRTQRMSSSTIRELLKLIQQPDIISFSGGYPAPEVFPVEEFQNACNVVLKDHGATALQYGATEGFTPLREFIASRAAAQSDIQVNVNNILITSGSQQALDLLGKIFINPGDRILVEDPTYLGALQAWNAYGAEYITIPSDENGMITETLEAALRYGPKFIYVLPNFQNPTGTTLALERRKQLAELADRYGVPIVEDDPYGQLRFEGEHLPTVEVVDRSLHATDHGHYTGNVIYLSTFSKILAPGIRLAWVIAPPEVISKLVQAKQGADLHTSTFNQMVAYEIARQGILESHLEIIKSTYKERRNIMLDCLSEHMPKGVHWTKPKGGLFLWITLPEGIDTAALMNDAIKEKVAFVPGAAFFSNGGGANTMRLNFSFSPPDKINEGIARLGRLIHRVV
ncbi:MAG: PLP-dependent aminotransferase family protein [Anaerolineaceae bacterium]|nr:PLP-dependent aminotransferase family protein [Anaerolineaceae bacterium]